MSYAQNYLPILQYHHVSQATPFSTSLTPEQFTEHMNYLKEENFNVIDLKSALDKIKAGTALPEKSVAITFDDAYRNIYENGFPILKSHQFPFTVFINTLQIEQKNRHFLTWTQMKEMSEFGGVFANHTFSHPYMLRKIENETDEEWLVRMKREVSSVEEALVMHLGSSPKMIAYPYGESNDVIQQWLTSEGIVGFGQQSGVVNADSNFANLPRFPAAGHYAKLGPLKTKLASQPMPLVSYDNGGIYADNEPVSISLTFKEGNYRLKDLTCYVSGQGKAKLSWIDAHHVVASAPKAFTAGRGRINCTMPDKSAKHYHWFSNVWIRPSADENYIQN
ncbi:polysaccharide deacetylase family protein [Marinomonas balearica]|nr:polysaccharide deacetylase family protein [Marinomonas balearica]